MIVWEEIVNRYVMSIFGKEALSVSEKGTPVGHVLEGKSLASRIGTIRISYTLPLLIFPAWEEQKDRRGTEIIICLSIFLRGKSQTQARTAKTEEKQGEEKNIRTYGRPALGVFFHISCIIDRSMFKERRREIRKQKGGEKRRRMKTKNT